LDIGPSIEPSERKTAREEHRIRQISKWSAEFLLYNNLPRCLFAFSNAQKHQLFHSSSSILFSFWVKEKGNTYQIVLGDIYLVVCSNKIAS